MKGIVLKALVTLLALYTMAVLTVVTPALAQEEPPGQVAASSSESDPEANLPYLFAVYTITWVAFFAYLFYLSQRQRDLRREVEELRRALAEMESPRAGPGHGDTR